MRERLDRNRRSVQALQNLFLRVVDRPSEYVPQTDLLVALRSQGAISRYSKEIENIYPSSLNTIKRIAANTIDGGFRVFDSLRLRAFDALEKATLKTSQPKRGTKAELMKVSAGLRLENGALRQDLLLLTYVFSKALSQGSQYATEAGKCTLERCRSEQRELQDMLMLQNNFIASNVVNIREL